MKLKGASKSFQRQSFLHILCNAKKRVQKGFQKFLKLSCVFQKYRIEYCKMAARDNSKTLINKIDFYFENMILK